MNFLIVALCALAGIWAYLRSHKIYHPIVLYMGVWGVLFFVYNLDWYPLPYVKSITYEIVLTGLASFFLGSVIPEFMIKNKKGQRIMYHTERTKFIKVGLIAFFILILPPFFNAYRLVGSGVDLHDIRYVYHDDIVGGGIIAILFVYFCGPFFNFYLMHSIAKIYSSHRNLTNIFFTLIGILMMIVITGGRFMLLYFIFALAISMMIYRQSPANKKVKKYSLFLLIVGTLSIAMVSVLRGSDVGQTFYVYLSGSIPFLDHLIEENGALPPTMGVYSLNGFIRPLFVTFRMLGIMDMPVFMQFVEEIQLQADEGWAIFPGESYNSFTTLFYSMYIDGRLVGVAIGNFLLGTLSMIAYKHVRENDSYTVVLYLLFAVMLLLSFFRLLVINYSYALSFIYLYICYSRKEVRDVCF